MPARTPTRPCATLSKWPTTESEKYTFESIDFDSVERNQHEGNQEEGNEFRNRLKYSFLFSLLLCSPISYRPNEMVDKTHENVNKSTSRKTAKETPNKFLFTRPENGDDSIKTEFFFSFFFIVIVGVRRIKKKRGVFMPYASLTPTKTVLMNIIVMFKGAEKSLGFSWIASVTKCLISVCETTKKCAASNISLFSSFAIAFLSS